MQRYCCEKKCFVLDNTIVDELVCWDCMATNQCYCKCITYMNKQKYCCNKKCFVLEKRCFEVPGLACDKCMYYGQCYYRCKYRTRWMRLKNCLGELLKSLKRGK